MEEVAPSLMNKIKDVLKTSSIKPTEEQYDHYLKNKINEFSKESQKEYIPFKSEYEYKGYNYFFNNFKHYFDDELRNINSANEHGKEIKYKTNYETNILKR